MPAAPSVIRLNITLLHTINVLPRRINFYLAYFAAPENGIDRGIRLQIQSELQAHIDLQEKASGVSLPVHRSTGETLRSWFG